MQDKNVITKNNKRKFCWKENFDDECKLYFDKFKLNYRSEEEAWFCLLKNVEPYHCEVCGKLAKFTGTKKTKYPGYNTTCENCSPNCATEKKLKFKKTVENWTDAEKRNMFLKHKQTNYKRYGDENYTLYGSDKFKQTMKERYGDENYSNREKCKQTCLEKYGVTCNLALNSAENSKRVWNNNYDKIITKIKETNLLHRGTEFPGQSKDVVQKIVDKKLKHVSEIEKEYNCTQQRKLIKLYGQGWLNIDLEKIVIDGRKFIANENIPIIKEYYATQKFVSNEEKDLLRYIKEIYKGEVKENTTNVLANNHGGRYELDIYLPNEHIAFEFNGIYWHSDKFKDKFYHQRKTLLCYAQGIQVVHIYENDWNDNKEQIKQQIKSLLEGNDCSCYNWVPLNKVNDYVLTPPNKKTIYNMTLYDEGTFIKI